MNNSRNSLLNQFMETECVDYQSSDELMNGVLKKIETECADILKPFDMSRFRNIDHKFATASDFLKSTVQIPITGRSLKRVVSVFDIMYGNQYRLVDIKQKFNWRKLAFEVTGTAERDVTEYEETEGVESPETNYKYKFRYIHPNGSEYTKILWSTLLTPSEHQKMFVDWICQTDRENDVKYKKSNP